MIIQPKIRGFICTTAHPVGCARNVQQQIDYVKEQGPVANGPKNVLVIGASTGYGLASRITAAFGSQAATIGVFFERPADGKRTATAGWYNSVALEQAAKKEGIYAKSVNGDAFSDEIRNKVIDLIKKDLKQVDLVIYSLASPRRTHPKTGEVFRSVLKPKGQSYTNKSFDFSADKFESVTLEAASEDEINQTIAVMGGEDWSMWIDALEKENLLAEGCRAVAYSYIGPNLTKDVYRGGTIGAAKSHLEQTAKKIDEQLKKIKGRAFVSVNKALVTQSSSAIPFIPLYYVLLAKVMDEKGVNENCIQQIYRLFSERLYVAGDVPIDEDGRIRVDEKELRADIQQAVEANWEKIDDSNVEEFADIKGYRKDFLNLFGFGFEDVDYNADVDPDLKLE